MNRRATAGTDVGLGPPLPHNETAERNVLGAILLNNDVLTQAERIVTCDDFFKTFHSKIFAAFVRMRDHIDPDLVVHHFAKAGRPLDDEEVVALTALPNGLPRASNVQQYARIVKDKSLRRRFIHNTSDLHDAAFDESRPLGDLFLQASVEIGKVRDLEQQQAAQSWREKFHTVGELPDGDTIFLIDRILPEGVTFLGALSGVGKTWFALSMARALTTGRKFLGVWDVPQPVDVLYLCPEMSAKTFKRRAQRFGLSERFRCQTIADGAPLNLADPQLTAAVRELRPVVFLDTAIRFSHAEDENSASDNQELARAIFSLLYAGAQAVVCLHHRAKETARAEEMTLENTLRGTGDLGAVAAAVYGLRADQLSGGNAPYLKESRRLVRLQVRCVKASDFVPVDDFRVQLEPYIDTIADMAVLADRPEPEESEVDRLSAAIAANPKATKVELQETTNIGRNRIANLAAASGWHNDRAKGVWVKT